ncbi:hypothetical protein EST38_g12119 [Candolleomyces aberdarensis]|uniref:Uncharacterized protein n=1 Tax=Candolleomyces aberdarensis TaxID=2316362 RepID=A0A4Q2D5T3_9AGAR|nr:hypothetical protein EST38_g12119 [Candolleomyces aberdarensis]
MEHSFTVWYRMYLVPTQSPPPSDDDSDNASLTTQEAIIRIANAAYDLRMELVLSKVAMMLTQPFSAFYRTDANRDAVAHAQQATTFFIWMPARDFFRGRVMRGARYVVLFHVTCEQPYRALCLAHTIVEYPSVKGGVHGAFVIGGELSHVYKKVKRYAKAKAKYYAMYKQRYPVTIWYANPHTKVSFTGNSLENLEAKVRKLL